MTFDTGHLGTISEIALQINSSLKITDVMNLIYQNIKKEMPISFFVISSYEERDDTLKVEFCVKRDTIVEEEFLTQSNNPNSLTAFTIKSRAEIIIHNLTTDFANYLSGVPTLHGKEDLRCESVLMFPLIVQNKIIGLFSVQHEEKNSYSEGNIELLRALCPFVSIALNNANQHTALAEKSRIIEEQNKDIIDSIKYAKYLQNAILPPHEFINEQVSDNFIYYKPKDIVAGDFYWAEKVNDTIFIAAADSTGHGVPGAMVSVVCSSALNRAISEFGLVEPGRILDKTSELVSETFEKSASEVKDGMDISLLSIDLKNKSVFWSGANNPLWYMHHGVLTELKADKQPIGKTEHPKPFRTHKIEFNENTTFYLFTDGFADQFGGSDGKKFKYKQFADLLVEHAHLSLKLQLENIDKAFMDWKGKLDQVDDVCVIGIKI